MYPPDEYCDYIFYTNVITSNGQIQAAKDPVSWTVFQKRGPKYRVTQLGISFDFQNVTPSGLDDASWDLYTLYRKGVRHYGLLNVLSFQKDFQETVRSTKGVLEVGVRGIAVHANIYRTNIRHGFLDAVNNFKADIVVLIASGVWIGPDGSCIAAPPNAVTTPNLRYLDLDGRSSSHKTSNASNDDTAATDRSLTPRQRGRRLALNSVASKQPRLPSDALKLIVRPREGLLLSKISNFILFEAVCTAANFPKASVRGEDLIQVNPKQNTFAYCTPAVERAERVLRLKESVIGTHTYEMSVYCAPDESQGRGVIRGVDLRLDHQGIQEELQDPRNPPIVDFRRLGNITAMLLTFKEPRVPTWIYLCNARHRCNLYKKFEVCYRCSELGHRADVCASTVIKCRGCAIPDPPSDHVCVPTCRLCGKQHITGDSRCKEIYRTPYIIKRRQWEALQQEEDSKQQDQATQRRVTLKRSSRWDRQRSRSTHIITAIVQLESAYLCYYSARFTGGEATWIYSFRNSFCGGAGEYGEYGEKHPHPPPMDTDSLAGTAPNRKVYEVGGTQPGDTQDQTMSETRTDQRFAALEATIEKYFQTLTAQFTQQLDSLSKALDARCNSYDAALGPASSSVTGGTNSHPNHGGPLA
ncbi:hypothetical protein MTO96_037945 [Rhipicephalus appendiculatus]